MPSIRENKDSGVVKAAGKRSTFQEIYVARGYTAAGSAIAAVRGFSSIMANFPPQVDGWLLNAVPVISTAPMTGINDWLVTIDYKVSDKDDDDNKDNLHPAEENPATGTREPEGRISFTFGGATEHVTQAIESSYYFVEGKSQPLPRNLVGTGINMGTDGEFMGVDRVAKSCQINIEKTFDGATFTNAKLKAYFNYIGQVNKSEWRTLEAQCVLLTGVDGAQNGQGNWPLNFTFEYRPPYYVDLNLPAGTTLKYGTDGTTTPSQTQLGPVNGHFYTWLYYQPSVDSDGQQDEASRTYSQIHVAKLYDNFEFSLLGID